MTNYMRQGWISMILQKSLNKELSVLQNGGNIVFVFNGMEN